MLEFVWLQKVIMLCVWVVGTWKGLSNDQRWWWWRWRMLVSRTRSFVATKLQTKLQIDTVKSLAVTKPQWVGNQPTISALMMTAWLFTLPSAVNSTCSQNGKGDAELMSFPLLSPIHHTCILLHIHVDDCVTAAPHIIVPRIIRRTSLHILLIVVSFSSTEALSHTDQTVAKIITSQCHHPR